MSLVEIMIAVFVLSVGLLALASTAITSIVNLRVSRGRQEATDAASAMLEDLRRSDFALVALDSDDPDVGALGDCDPDYDEPYVTTSQPDAIPHVQTFGPSGRVTVTTTVSWYDDPETGDQGCLDSDHDKRVKRVQVVAEWDDDGRTHSVQESTLVAEVDRGLPAPDFRLGTPDATVVFTPDDIDTERERCVGHVLRNVGAADGYEWTATRTDTGSVEKNNAARYWTADGKFYLRAFFENTAQDPPLNPADYDVPKDQTDRHANLPSGLELMVDGSDANSYPDTESTLDTGEQARLWICYWLGSNAGVDDSAEFDVTASSQFDPNRTETVHHVVKVTDRTIDMFLYDDYVPEETHTPTTDEASTERVVETNGNKEILPVLPMGPIADTEPEILGTTPELPNYDIDFDTYPGLRLQDAPRIGVSEDDWPASTVTFHEQISPDTTFSPVADLVLWSASESALEAAEAGATDVASRQLDYRILVQVLDKNENHVQATLLDADLSYSHSIVGWDDLSFADLPLNGGSDFTIQKDQYVRLHITCQSTSEDTCHLAYDHESFPSLLRLVVKS